MERFPSSGHLASWCGLCPGNAESAGKRHSGKTNKGNRYVRCVLVQSAWAAARIVRERNFFTTFFFRVSQRAGMKKAAIAVAHRILTIVYSMIRSGDSYREQRSRLLRPPSPRTHHKPPHSAARNASAFWFTSNQNYPRKPANTLIPQACFTKEKGLIRFCAGWGFANRAEPRFSDIGGSGRSPDWIISGRRRWTGRISRSARGRSATSRCTASSASQQVTVASLAGDTRRCDHIRSLTGIPRRLRLFRNRC